MRSIIFKTGEIERQALWRVHWSHTRNRPLSGRQGINVVGDLLQLIAGSLKAASDLGRCA